MMLNGLGLGGGALFGGDCCAQTRGGTVINATVTATTWTPALPVKATRER